ncbi:MAG TPA: SusC/RagA family TonB-linked outer membrane protein [Cyclobacteriaceae bacterium]|nr:SusC/RagA family TonB-linked outer membrane protein [Cyclobacteriaceae bacterium]
MNIYKFVYSLFEWSTHSKRLVIVALLVCPLFTSAQQKSYTLKGTVKDNNGGIPGVSVLVENTTTGSITDQNGNYQLVVSTDKSTANLVFSFIGYKQIVQQVTLDQDNITVDATMEEETKQLDEIVVTGSTLRANKRELGNNISTVSAQSLENSGTTNLFGALQGKIPGAQITQNSGDPSGGMTIRIRGVKSLSGPSDPLYVIDGVVVSNSTVNVSQTPLNGQVGATQIGTNRLADINPSDIETINVINGGAAAAIYGTRAANGVVMITTKKGKSGAPRLSFSTSMNMNELRKKVPISTYGKQFGYAALRLHTIGTIANPATYVPPAGVTGETFIPITRDGVLGYLRSNLVDVTRYDYQDQIFQQGLGTDNNLSLSGGNDKTQYFTSLAYTKNQGIIKGTDFTRYTLRARIDQRLADWAKLSVGLTYANSFSNEKANGNVFYSPINSINITNNIYDITQRDAAGNLQAVEPTRVNPLSTIEDMTFTQSVNRVMGNIQLNLTPVKGLGIDWVMGVDSYSQLGSSYIKPYPYQATAGLPAERYPSGYAGNASNNVLLLNTDLNISYEKQLSSDFKLNAIVGGSYQYQRADYFQANGQNLAPFITTVSGASASVVAGYGLDQWNLSGYFAQATIGYKNLAFITAAVRQDQSSKFSSSQRTQTFPKLSGSFVVSDLDFWKEKIASKNLNSLRLRASYGEVGNFTGIDTYGRFWQFNPVSYLGRNTVVPSSQLANPEVKPERMKETEGGFDLGLLNNRITLGASFYSQTISDLVVNRNLAASEGGLSIVNNVGQMENKGMEIMLDVVAVKSSQVTWDVAFIYNRNRNKVISLGTPTISIASAGTGNAFLIEGMPASVFYGTAIARDANGNPLLTVDGNLQSEKGTQSSSTPLQYTVTRDGAGQPTGSNIRAVIGNPNPDFTGSIVSNLGYKNFTFNFLLDFVQGVSVFNADRRTRQGVGIGNYAEQELRGQINRGYIYALYNTEEWRVESGSFTKLREVGLSYNFRDLIKLQGVSNITLGFTGRNLISWDSYSGYDPETNAGGNSDLLRGVDFGNVPVPRTYKLQLNVTF